MTSLLIGLAQDDERRRTRLWLILIPMKKINIVEAVPANRGPCVSVVYPRTFDLPVEITWRDRVSQLHS